MIAWQKAQGTNISQDKIFVDGVKVIYLYRDADNYKFHGSFCLVGVLDIRYIEEYLFDGEYFIPSKVGLDDLQPPEKTAADHFLHEIIEINQQLVPIDNMTAEEFIRRLKSVNSRGWFNE